MNWLSDKKGNHFNDSKKPGIHSDNSEPRHDGSQESNIKASTHKIPNSHFKIGEIVTYHDGRVGVITHIRHSNDSYDIKHGLTPKYKINGKYVNPSSIKLKPKSSTDENIKAYDTIKDFHYNSYNVKDMSDSELIRIAKMNRDAILGEKLVNGTNQQTEQFRKNISVLNNEYGVRELHAMEDKARKDGKDHIIYNGMKIHLR